MASRDIVLIVDDDPQICTLLRDYLAGFGIDADTAGDGPAMRAALQTRHYDAVILDVMLPGDDGLTLCRELRAHTQVAILMLTARAEPLDRVIGLELGADDYIPKPFEPRELLARLRAVLRRTQGERVPALAPTPAGGDRVYFKGWTLDRIARQVTTPEGVVVPISNAEFKLLCLFIDHAGRVLDRDQIMRSLHGRASEPNDRSIDLLVSRLRQKLHEQPGSNRLLRTVRGEGYLLDARIER